MKLDDLEWEGDPNAYWHSVTVGKLILQRANKPGCTVGERRLVPVGTIHAWDRNGDINRVVDPLEAQCLILHYLELLAKENHHEPSEHAGRHDYAP